MTQLLGVLSDVHSRSAKSRVLGLLESVCEKALCVELAERGLNRVLFEPFAFICGKKEDIK